MTRTVVRGRASEAQRRLWETVREGQALALKKMKPGVDGLKLHNEVKQLFTDRGYPDGSAQWPAGRIFPRHRPRPRAGDPRVSAVPKDRLQDRAKCSRSSRGSIIRASAARAGGCGGFDEDGHSDVVAFRKAAGNLNEARSARLISQICHAERSRGILRSSEDSLQGEGFFDLRHIANSSNDRSRQTQISLYL